METRTAGELPEAKWSYPLTFWELVDALSDSPKTRFLSSTGTLLTDEEFSDRYLTPSDAEKSVKFRAVVDDSGVLVIRPEFDVEKVIAGVQGNLEKVIRTARKTTQTRKEIKRSATWIS